MIKGINYWAFPSEGLGAPAGGLNHRSVLRQAKELGYDAVELTVDGPEGLISLSSTQADADTVRREADSLGVRLDTVASGLAWGASPTDPDPAVRDQAVRNATKVLEIASWLGAHTILYLPGMVSASFVPSFTPQRYDQVLDRARESLEKLIPTAEKLGVRIGIENVWNRFLLGPVEMRDFIDSFSTDMVGAYFDTGNCMLYGHPEHWIEILGARIFAVHLKDFRRNVGNLDGFVDLLAGDLDVGKVFRAFSAIGYSGPYTIEYVPATPGAAEKGIAALRLLEAAEGAWK